VRVSKQAITTTRIILHLIQHGGEATRADLQTLTGLHRNSLTMYLHGINVGGYPLYIGKKYVRILDCDEWEHRTPLPPASEE
jgi:hypothetical protein